MPERTIKTVLTAQPVMEGAGVHLKRAFSNREVPLFDPFLMLDDFRNDNPAHYLPGFPWHPHRGIETITYMLEGSAEHGDSLGNQGILRAGDVQWMTAGSGIIHQEMPKPDAQGRMYGFQLWANLPASHKMMKPRYQDITAAQIPILKTEEGATIKVICGSYQDTIGPVQDIITSPQFFDLYIPSGCEFTLDTTPGFNCFIYAYQGTAEIAAQTVHNHQVVLFEDGNSIRIKIAEHDFRCIFLSGKPLKEPVAWGGPIVMNTKEELNLAFEEYHNGTFIK